MDYMNRGLSVVSRGERRGVRSEKNAPSPCRRLYSTLAPHPSLLTPRSAFTLVELLVVITIIAILASLITVAAVAALRKAQATRIKAEIDQISTALQTYKDTAGSFPPNCQVDDNSETGGETAATPLIEAQVLTDLKRHMKQAFPRSREPDTLLRALVGLGASGSNLAGGMSADESLVFWLGGFSSDPEYPISGEGGPSYKIPSLGASTNRTIDPIDNRKWVFPFDVQRLKPRMEDDGFFDESFNRFLEYQVPINGANQNRRINFWHYTPAKATQPFVYFDTSRHPAAAAYDPPAATALSANAMEVHAFKKAPASATATVPDFANADKFQVLHAGIDDQWGDFEPMSIHATALNSLLYFPDGPFTGEVADTIVNFISQTKIEDAQP